MHDSAENQGLRHVVLDVETTGLCAGNGHSIAEIAAIELVDHRVTGRYFHSHLNPERAIDTGFAAIHGLSAARLQDKLRFSEVVSEFIAFVDGASLVAHNAPFDLAFIDRELAQIGRKPLESHCFAIVDSLSIARMLRPGAGNSLGALCEARGITAAGRNLRGARLDAAMLAGVFLWMTS